MKTFSKLALVAFVFGLFTFICLARANKEGPKIGDVPPPLVLSQILHGPSLEQVSWEKLKGKVVLLEFWNIRCAPCVAAIPHLNKLVDHFANSPVMFLSVTDDNPDHAKDFLKLKPMKGWIAIDGPLTASRTAFGVEGIPHTVIVDKAGKIAAITHPAKLEAKHLEEVLAGKPCSLPVPEPFSRDEEVVAVSTPVPKIIEVSISGPFPQPNGAFNFRGWDKSRGEFTAKKAYLRDALGAYFGLDEKFVIADPTLPNGLYDITVFGSTNKATELQSQFGAAIQTAFGFTLRTNYREMEVYEMTFATTNAPNLKPANKGGGGGGEPGGFTFRGSRMNSIARLFADALNKPVLDETRSTNLWSVDMKWEMTAAEMLPYRIGRLAGSTLSEKVWDDSPDAQTIESVRKKISPEDFAVLKTEFSKPAKERFQADSAKVIKAAHELLGLKLTLTKRVVPVLEITKAEK